MLESDTFYTTFPFDLGILYDLDLTSSSLSPGGDKGVSLNCNVYKHQLPGCHAGVE